MNEPQAPDDDVDELDERYRRAGADDASRPSERTRAAILAHARGMAEARRRPAAQFTKLHAANDRYWWRAAVASVAIGGLALMIWTPRYQTAGTAARVAPASAPTPTPQASESAAPPRADESAVPPATAPVAPPAGAAAPAARQYVPEPPPETPQVARGATTSRLAPSSEARTAAAPPAAAVAPPAAAASDAAVAAQANVAADAQRYAGRRDEVGAAVAAARPRSAGAAALGSSMAMMAADPASQLRTAIGAGDVVRVQSLIAASGAVEARDARGRTPLMLAALAGQVDVLRVLIEAGADVNARDGDGRSALDYARAANRPDLATMLEVRGAN